ncbi:unnamed protein product [Aphanomyces euteiches]
MFISFGALHRNPKYWSDPDEFIPERFLEGTAPYEADKALRHGQGNTFAYMPFSTGSKNCIGNLLEQHALGFAGSITNK